MSYNVGVSTLHGSIHMIRLEPDTLVKDFKQHCMEVAWLPTPLVNHIKVNVDVAELLTSMGSAQDEMEGVRLADVSGNMLDDSKSIGSQVTLGEDQFMFKLVFFKQTNLSHRDNAMIADFADHGTRTSGYIVPLQPHGTEFVVMPVWGGVDRPDHILGVIYQHRATERHCHFMSRGVDPRGVDTQINAFMFDLQAVNYP